MRSPPRTTGVWQHTPPSAGWLGHAALTAAGPAHHSGQRGESAADRTTCYCVSSTASTAPSAEGRADRPTVDLCSPSYSWRTHHHYSGYEHGSGAEQTVQQQQSKATHLQSVLTQQRPNCMEGTPLGTPPDSQGQAVKEHVSSS